MKQILLFTIAILFTSFAAFAQADECSNATPLTLESGASCTAGGSYTWTGATASAGHPAPGCASYSTGDVWFSFTIPAGSNQDIFITTSSSLDGGGALYSGDCASTSLISCSDDDAGGLDPEISATDLAPGTYYFRFWDYDDGTSGDVDICVSGVIPPPPPAAPAANCADANPLCSDALGQEYAANTTGTAEAGNNYGCLSTQPRPSWFYFQAASAGNLEIQINNTVDLDFAMWGPFPDLATALGTCGSLSAPVDCSYSATAQPEVANYTGAAAGDVFVLLITAYSSTTTTFTVTEGAGMTASTDCNILTCSAAITETTSASNFVYCHQMTGSTTVGMDANSGSGYVYTFDAGSEATANAGVAFAEICGNYDPAANTTPGDPTTNPNYTNFFVNDGFDYGSATADGLDPYLGCDYITLVPMTHIDVDAVTGEFITDPDCFATGTAFIVDFYPEITAVYDCSGKIVVDGGSPDDIGNAVPGEYVISGDVSGTTSGGEYVVNLADGTYNITVTDPHGCEQSITLTFDCCGASAVALAPSGTSTATAQCDEGTWTYYYDPAVPGDMLFAIEWAPDGTLSAANAAAKSAAMVDIVLGTMDAKVTALEASYAMARYWDVNTSAFDEAVNVKFFYDPLEKTAVETAATGSGLTYEGFKWFKTPSGTYGPNTHNTPDGVVGVIELIPAATGTENSITYVQFDGIASFSGGTGAAGAGTQGVILPIELISFSGKERDAVNLLEWATASEKDTEWMVIERSADGKDGWTTVGEVAAYGNTNETQYYQLEDTRPLNLSYYRLKSIDTDGSFQLSNVISIRRATNGFEIANISPNPTKDVLNVGVVAGTDAPTTLVLRDIAGRELQRYQFETTAGDNNFSINLNDVSNGIYLLTIENSIHRLIEKIVKN